MTAYDAIVVGAGPAGAICARSLGMGGARVLLIDKEHFPRDKPCGDYLSSRLCDRLKKVGLYEPLEKAPHCIIEDILFSHPSVGSFLMRDSLNREASSGILCKREHLDAVFVEEAKKHVEVLEGIKVKSLIINQGQVVGVATDTKNYSAKIVIGADGANGVTAKALGAATLDENHHAVSVRSYYTHVKGLTASAELHFIDQVQPGYFWIFPVNLKTGEANVGLGILSRNVRNRNVQLKKLLETITQEHSQFRDRFAEAQCVAPVKGWSLPFGSKKRPLAFPGALLIGDAGGLIDPMSGEGIENAFRSSLCASEYVLKALSQNNFTQKFLQQYEDALETLLRSELRRGYFIQKVSRNPIVLNLVFRLLKHSRTSRRIIANKFF